MNFNNKKIMGVMSIIVGILLISFSTSIPIPILEPTAKSIVIYVVGALLIANGVLSFIGPKY
jgi:predicted phage tail protein